ncbi:MAG: hypothetical protein ACRDHP_07870 [Ktedonobacterales bacterium]
MSAPPPSPDDPDEAGRYEIRLKGHLDTRWAIWFDGLRLSHERDGTTLIQGPVVDQAALHGLLRRVRDLGLPLVSVNQVVPNVDPTPANGPDDNTDTNHTRVNEESET